MSLVHPARQGIVAKTKPTITGATYVSTSSEASLLLVGTSGGVVDLSKNNWTVNINSGISASQTQTKFRDYSVDVASTAWATLGSSAGSSEFLFGTGDYTWESWVWFKTTGVYTILAASIRFGGSTGFMFQVDPSRVDSYLTGSAKEQPISPAMSTSVWNHIALVRKDGVVSWYINGNRILQYTQNVSNTVPYDVSISADDNGPARSGNIYFSDLRIVKGAALYQGDSFQVPTEALTTSSLSIQVIGDITDYGVNQVI